MPMGSQSHPQQQGPLLQQIVPPSQMHSYHANQAQLPQQQSTQQQSSVLQELLLSNNNSHSSASSMNSPRTSYSFSTRFNFLLNTFGLFY